MPGEGFRKTSFIITSAWELTSAETCSFRFIWSNSGVPLHYWASRVPIRIPRIDSFGVCLLGQERYSGITFIVTHGESLRRRMSSEFPDEMAGLGLGGSMDEKDGGDGDDEEIEHERLLVFEIGNREYAVTVDAVRTVVEPEDITRVPLSSAAIEGIMDLRGEITAVINPKVHFGVASSDWSELERLVIFNRPPDRQPAGIRVDNVVGVEAFPAPLFYSLEEIDPDEYRGHEDLLSSVVTRFENGEVVERIGLIDTEAMVEASGQVAAEPIS